jgi:hypothetical protein
MLEIPAFGRLRSEECEVEFNLDYTVRPILKNKTKLKTPKTYESTRRK